MNQPMEDDLAVLRRLRDGAQLSTDEFEGPDDGYLDAPPDTGDAHLDIDDVVEETTAEGDDAKTEGPLATPIALRDDLDVRYLSSLAVASITLGVASSAGLLSWLVSIPMVLVLLTTLVQGWHRVTLFSSAFVAVLLIASVVTSSPDAVVETPPTTQPVAVAPQTPPPTQAPVTTLPTTAPSISGSLEIHMDEVAALWNSVDGPQITTGLTRQSETGEYDSFIYRFGEWGRLLGAFDPDTEVVYALVASGQFSNEATDQLYVHLCNMVEQFNPECLEFYQELGLDGAALEDYTGTTHEAEWTLGTDTWRLQIEGNVLTIRVFGADAA